MQVIVLDIHYPDARPQPSYGDTDHAENQEDDKKESNRSNGIDNRCHSALLTTIRLRLVGS